MLGLLPLLMWVHWATIFFRPACSSESDSEALYPDPLGLTSSANVATGRKTSCCVEMCWVEVVAFEFERENQHNQPTGSNWTINCLCFNLWQIHSSFPLEIGLLYLRLALVAWLCIDKSRLVVIESGEARIETKCQMIKSNGDAHSNYFTSDELKGKILNGETDGEDVNNRIWFHSFLIPTTGSKYSESLLRSVNHPQENMANQATPQHTFREPAHVMVNDLSEGLLCHSFSMLCGCLALRKIDVAKHVCVTRITEIALHFRM